MHLLRHLPIVSAVVLAGTGTASAVVLSFEGGETTAGNFTGTPGNFVLDIGFKVPVMNTTNPILFETGGDGIGTALALVGTSLEVFQDQNSGNEPTISLDITPFLGQTVTIRLGGDFSQPNGSRTLSLEVRNEGGIPLGGGLTNISTADSRFSGGDGTGFGGVNGTLGGQSESGSPVAGFDNAARDVAGPGSSVLLGDVLVGTLYSAADADTQRGTGLPAPSSFSFVPEPSSALLLLFGGLGLTMRRRR